MKWVLLCLSPLIIFDAVLVGCAGMTVRKEVLLPLAKKVYVSVEQDVDRGIQAGIDSSELTFLEAEQLKSRSSSIRRALKSDDVSALSLDDWSLVEPWAARGVQDRVRDGEVSEGAATSLYQRIVNFRDLLRQLKGSGQSPTGGTRKYYFGGHYAGSGPVFRPVRGDTPEEQLLWIRHNSVRSQLGVPLVSEQPSYLLPDGTWCFNAKEER